MEELKVPKNQKTVELLMAGEGRKVKDYDIYLSRSSRLMTGEETVEEFLRHTSPFFPATDKETGQTVFINKNTIIFLREKEDSEEKPVNPLRLELSNGQDQRISQFLPIPEYQTRPADAFITEENFLVFLQGRKKIYINKAHVQCVIPLD